MASIGLDIGNHSIKCLEIKNISKQPTLVNFAIFESDKLKLDFSNEDALNLYILKIKEFISEMDLSSNEVNLSLSDSDVFLSVQTLPKMTHSEIVNYISLQSTDLFPENINNLTYDFKILSEKEGQKIEVLIVAAKRDRVEKYIDLVKRAGLVPHIFEAKSISNARIIDESTDQNPIMILDLGFNSSTLSVCYRKTPRFIKSIPIGSNSFNKTLVQNLNLTLMQAEEYKKSYGMVEDIADGRIYEFLKPLVDSYILDIKRAIVYYLDKNKGQEIQKIYLTGGLASMPGLREYFVKNLNYEVEVFDIFSKIKVSNELKKYQAELEKNSSLLTNCAGLAVIDIL